MFNGRKNLFVIMLAGALVVGLSTVAMAQTPSGTVISNTATLDYSVGGAAQAQVSSGPVTFLVDNKVDLTVTTIDGALVPVIPNTLAQVLTYTVTNNGNTVQDYSLVAQNSATGAFGGAENFDATGVAVFVDVDGDNTYTAATDTDLYIDELAASGTITVFVVANIPQAQVNGDVASYDLIAQTAVGGATGSPGADITSDDNGSADDPTSVQIVFADGAGTADGLRDGQHSSVDGYIVVTANLTAVKTFNVISDPVNGSSNPKAIPGAEVGYQVLVTNTGTVNADAVEVIDSIPANSAFLVASVTTNPVAGATVFYSIDGGTDWTHTPVADANGTDINVTDVRVVFATVVGGANAQENFSVLID